MTQWRLRAFDGGHPVDFLATLGIVTSSASARVKFAESREPTVEHSDLDALADEVITAIAETCRPDRFPWDDSPDLRSTIPSWSALNPLAAASWTDHTTDRLLRTFDLGSIREGEGKKTSTDPKVRPAATVLISGKSYLKKSLMDLWPVSSEAKKSAHESDVYDELLTGIEEDFRMLFNGDRPRSELSTRGNALRLTATEPSPRLRTGIEGSYVTPLTEMLALLGMTSLLPGQQDQGGRGLVWTLPPVPLSGIAMVDLHESQLDAGDWPTFSAKVRPIGGGTNALHFVDVAPTQTARSNPWTR